MKDIICTRCQQMFTLAWDSFDSKPRTLIIRGCPSGGIYDVFIRCPYCSHEESI